jgi:hypothetical protein
MLKKGMLIGLACIKCKQGNIFELGKDEQNDNLEM